MTREEFITFLCRDGASWDQLSHWLTVEPCDCGEEFCDGWQTRLRPDYPTP